VFLALLPRALSALGSSVSPTTLRRTFPAQHCALLAVFHLLNSDLADGVPVPVPVAQSRVWRDFGNNVQASAWSTGKSRVNLGYFGPVGRRQQWPLVGEVTDRSS
jgi:hypothetical protein